MKEPEFGNQMKVFGVTRHQRNMNLLTHSLIKQSLTNSIHMKVIWLKELKKDGPNIDLNGRITILQIVLIQPIQL